MTVLAIIAACVAVAIVSLVIVARMTDDREYTEWRDGR